MAMQENRDQAPKKCLGKHGQRSKFSVRHQLCAFTASSELFMLGEKGLGSDILYKSKLVCDTPERCWGDVGAVGRPPGLGVPPGRRAAPSKAEGLATCKPS